MNLGSGEEKALNGLYSILSIVYICVFMLLLISSACVDKYLKCLLCYL